MRTSHRVGLLILLGLSLDLLALPPGPLPLAILVADVPFLWLIGGGGGRRWRRLAWLYGLLHFGVALRWLAEVHPVQVAGAAVVLAFAYLFAAMAIRALVGRGLPYVLVVPSVLVLEELFRTWWFGGMPWPTRSLSFTAFPDPLAGRFVASTATLGAYALSFLAGLTGAVLARQAPGLALAFRRGAPQRASAWSLLLPCVVALGLLVSGGARISMVVGTRPGVTHPPRVLLAVQANIPQSLKHTHEPGGMMRMFQAHLELTRMGLSDTRARGERVVAVLWPETMIPWPFVSTELAHRFPDEWENGLRILQHVREVAEAGDAATRYLLGAVHHFRRGDELHTRVFRYGTHDSLFLVDPLRVPSVQHDAPPPPQVGDESPWWLGRHDKHVLVPGGEYTPMGDTLVPLRLFRDLVSAIPPLDPGAEDQQPFTLDDSGADGRPPIRAGTVICFELLFPARCRAWRSRGSDVLLNAANYGWFGPTGFRAQLRAAAALRAAETGTTVVVAGNTGPTAFFDPLGRRYGRFVSGDETVTEDAGLDPTTFTAGHAVGTLRNAPSAPPYVHLGDVPWLALGGLWLLLGALQPTRRWQWRRTRGKMADDGGRADRTPRAKNL